MPVITERYEATVTSTDDDEMRGRIKVTCAGLIPWQDGVDPTALPMFIEPMHAWGCFAVPDVGEVVEIEVIVSNDEEESFGQATLESLNPRWRGKRFISENEIEDEETDGVARVVHPDFKTNYPKRRGFNTPWGHIVFFDDTDGSQQITLKWLMEQLAIGEEVDPTKATEVTIEPDGSLLVNFLNKHRLHFTTEKGNLRIALDGEAGSEKHSIVFDAEAPKVEISLAEGAHTLTLDGTKFTANVDGGASMSVVGKDGDAVTTLGDGAVHAAIVEHLEAFWTNTVQPYLDAQVYPTSMGPTGPNATPAPSWDGSINSTKVEFPDG